MANITVASFALRMSIQVTRSNAISYQREKLLSKEGEEDIDSKEG
jgi:hypothetical protein